MKKTFTLFFMALGLSLTTVAQTLTFSHEGTAIADGSTFTSKNIYEDPLGDMFNIPDEIRPEIHLACSANATVVCTVEDIDNIGGIKFCFGGDCQTSGTAGIYTMTKEYTFSGSSIDIQLDFVLPLTGYATGKAKVSAWVKGKEATTKVTINVVMSNDPSVSSIGTTEIKDAVKLISKSLHYEFATAANRTLTVYGLSGAQVFSAPIEGTNGEVHLNALPKGVYIYRVSGVSPTIQRKFILK